MRSPSRHSIRYGTGARGLATNPLWYSNERVWYFEQHAPMRCNSVLCMYLQLPDRGFPVCFKLHVRCDAGITSSSLHYLPLLYRWSFFSCRYGMFGIIASKSCSVCISLAHERLNKDMPGQMNPPSCRMHSMML
ncbi:hypothetical protein V8C34DRAFT_51665 [Trichoderma compactum]